MKKDMIDREGGRWYATYKGERHHLDFYVTPSLNHDKLRGRFKNWWTAYRHGAEKHSVEDILTLDAIKPIRPDHQRARGAAIIPRFKVVDPCNCMAGDLFSPRMAV